MRVHENHPGPEIEVTLASNEIRWRAQGEDGVRSAPFHLPGFAFRKLRKDYVDLVNLARTRCDGGEYKRQEKVLGEELAGFLLRMGNRDNELATALNRLLCELQEGEYVRLLLRFEGTTLGNLPWELTLWESLETGRELCLGRHGDIALSRLERARSAIRPRIMTGQDRTLSILNIGTDDAAAVVFARTSAFIRLIDDYIPQVHTASRQSVDLKRYWTDCFKILGGLPEVDIVHWNGHGSSESVDMKSKSGNHVTLSAAELIERTRGAFLYVVQSCHSGGSISGLDDGDGDGEEPSGGDDAPALHNTFSAALLAHGASAVLGMHDGVAANQFECLPILYVLLFQGLPLDYCVQFMRRFFWQGNAEDQKGPYEPWYKLMLRTSSVSYLGAPTATLLPPSMDPMLVVDALAAHCERSFAGAGAQGQCMDGEQEEDQGEQVDDAAPGHGLRGDGLTAPGGGRKHEDTARPRGARDTLLKRLYDTALMK